MSILGLFNQSIVIYPKSGYDKFGKPTNSTPATVSARVQKTTRQRLLPNNSLVLILAIVYVPATTVVSVEDKVTYQSIDYKVFSVNEAVKGDGSVHHIKLELQKWQT